MNKRGALATAATTGMVKSAKSARSTPMHQTTAELVLKELVDTPIAVLFARTKEIALATPTVFLERIAPAAPVSATISGPRTTAPAVLRESIQIMIVAFVFLATTGILTAALSARTRQTATAALTM